MSLPLRPGNTSQVNPIAAEAMAFSGRPYLRAKPIAALVSTFADRKYRPLDPISANTLVSMAREYSIPFAPPPPALRHLRPREFTLSPQVRLHLRLTDIST